MLKFNFIRPFPSTSTALEKVRCLITYFQKKSAADTRISWDSIIGVSWVLFICSLHYSQIHSISQITQLTTRELGQSEEQR